MKQEKLKGNAAQYIKIVEWSEADGCFVGSAPPLIGPCCHGSEEAKVYAELCKIVTEWIKLLNEDGQPLPAPTAGKKYSGKFVLRVDPAMHRKLALKAQAEGESLNNFCAKALAKA